MPILATIPHSPYLIVNIIQVLGWGGFLLYMWYEQRKTLKNTKEIEKKISEYIFHPDHFK